MTESARNRQLQLYLDRYQLSIQDVAHLAEVPLMTMWRAVHGQPITTAHAAAIRKALYAGPIETGLETIINLQAYREQRSGGAQ
jgi:hypothetical protein